MKKNLAEMFKFLCFLTIVSFASAGPTYPLVGYGYGVPSASSYSSRVYYNAPAISKTLLTSPFVLAYAYGVPAATSYNSRVDYNTPVVAKTLVTSPVVPAIAYDVPAATSYSSSSLYNGNGLGYKNHGYGIHY